MIGFIKWLQARKTKTMSFSDESTPNRVRSMFLGAGIQFRSNLITEVGGEIDLHEHSYAHIAMITHGWFEVTEITKEGETKMYQVASNDFTPVDKSKEFKPVGYYVLIPAYHKHAFRLIESHGKPGQVLCMWGSDGSEDHEGC